MQDFDLSVLDRRGEPPGSDTGRGTRAAADNRWWYDEFMVWTLDHLCRITQAA